MASDGAMAMMCCTTWAGVLPDISARGHRALEGGIPLLHPYMCKGISLCTIEYIPYSCGLYGCTSFKVSDHTCKVSCDMLHSEVALVAKHW